MAATSPDWTAAGDATYLNLKCEADRLKTFDLWSVPFMDKHKLAAAGFFYFNERDLVECVFCGVEVGNWKVGDDPFNDHRKWAPFCPYLRRYPVGNIPLNASTANITPMPQPIYDVCGPYEFEIRPNSSSCQNVDDLSNQMSLGINLAREPLFDLYATLTARMKSFKTWPVSIKQRPENLTEAGLYYTGKGDKTICFHCGGDLKDWEEADDPWIKHAKLFPKCLYVLLKKGKEFVARVNGEENRCISSKGFNNSEVSSELKGSLQIQEPVALSAQGEPLPSTSGSNKGGDNALLCKICFQEELGVLFLPCSHLVACVKCAPSLSVCPMCRQPFTGTVRTFLS